MPISFEKLLRRLDREYENLSNMYSEESLHTFRVNLRRVRSLLRNDTSRKVRKLRCQLGKLSRTTNQARDWDTLASRAIVTLSPQALAHLQSILEARQAESRLPAFTMLRSKRWPHVRHSLKKIIKAQGGALAVDLCSDAELCRARRRVNRAWHAVQADGTDRTRHKLRIAIKDLRYRMQVLPACHQTPAIANALKLSKRVQESLGVWHDAVVHAKLLQELRGAMVAQGQLELVGICDTLLQHLGSEAQQALAQVADELSVHGSVLAD
jgi:CHAD domain-containing protein